MLWILLTIAAAATGGVLLLKLKIPGGMLVGAIIGVVILNIFTGQAYIYPQTRVIAQVLTGSYIGCMVTREDLLHMPKVIGPFAVVIGSFLVLNLLTGFFIYRVTNLDLLTCLFCAAPGGINDTTLVAMDMGANASMVAVMQFVRMIFGMGCLPTIILLSDHLLEPGRELQAEVLVGHETEEKKAKADFVKFIPTLIVALCAGVIGKLTGIPAGTLSFSLVAVIVLKFLGNVPPMPMWLRRLAQVISGCCIGASITREHIFSLRQLIFPAVVLCVGYILCCIGVGYGMARLFHMDLKESMLCLSPAGATEMALIAADLGVHSANLIVLQICRLLCVEIVFPQIFMVLILVFA